MLLVRLGLILLPILETGACSLLWEIQDDLKEIVIIKYGKTPKKLLKKLKYLQLKSYEKILMYTYLVNCQMAHGEMVIKKP